jgi:4a-hydroxytetrahydrobiopterin dehydratase
MVMRTTVTEERVPERVVVSVARLAAGGPPADDLAAGGVRGRPSGTRLTWAAAARLWDAEDIPTPGRSVAMPVEPLSQKEIEDRLAELPGWSVVDGRLTRSYRLGTHFAATAMVVHVAQVQEELDHHSDLTLGYNTVELSVHTHSAGGALTGKDFELAQRVEALAAGHGAQ